MTQDAKTITNLALGAAETCAFAFGPVGVGVAAAIATGKALFDIFYDPSSGVADPMAQTPNRADLKIALDELRANLDDDIFTDFTNTYKADLFAASETLDTAIRNAGSVPKEGCCLPGPTPLWNNGLITDDLWDPLKKDPDIFRRTMEWIEPAISQKYSTAPLYALCVGINLVFLKTALVWEVNNNLKDYLVRKAAYDAAMAKWKTDHSTWEALGSDPKTEPPKPTDPEPSKPEGGDPAVGSQQTDQGGLNYTYLSHLGKVSSKWATATRDLLRETDDDGNKTGPITHLEGVLNDYDAAMTAKNKAVQARIDAVVTSPLIAGKPTAPWSDTKAGKIGTPFIPHAGFQWLQADIWAQSEAGNMDGKAIKDAKLDKLAADDIKRLRDTIVKWRETLDMYETALKTLDDGPLNPSDVLPQDTT